MSLIKLFDNLPDGRRAQGQMYKLNHVVLCAILSIMCGAKSYRDINRFIKVHIERLNRLFGITWKRAPAHTTLRGILCLIKKEVLEFYFRQYSQAMIEEREGHEKAKIVIAIDGKALKGSFDHTNEQGIIGLVSAYCAQSQLILGHLDVGNADHELTVVRDLLQGFGLKNCIYTLDALHCQKKHLI